MSSDGRCPTLVLGIGNILLRDEGVGVRVIEQMRAVDLPKGIELVDGVTAGADLLDTLAERRKVIIVDAVHADCVPGTVVRFGADDLAKPEREGISLHELGLYEALIMTEKLGCAPEEVVVFGVKPKEVGYGLELTKEIETIVPDIIELVLAEVDK